VFNQRRARGKTSETRSKLRILALLTDPALVGNHKSSIIIHFTLSNVVPEIGFSDLVARVELNANKKGASSDVGTINPLTVNLGTVNIETPWRYSLITAPSAIPPLFKTRVTLCVL